jgi:CRISPR-associated endonuclease/helicase Cas3
MFHGTVRAASVVREDMGKATASFQRYWGKADPSQTECAWHPIACHSLDVAAVAAAWWDASAVVRQRFALAFGSGTAEAQIRAWVLLLVSLHDIGKVDARFQLKAGAVARLCWPGLDERDIDSRLVRSFDHGQGGYARGSEEFREWVGASSLEPERQKRWNAWLSAVTGHHGDLPASGNMRLEYAESHVVEHDRRARRDLAEAFSALFLDEVSASLSAGPPPCDSAAQRFLAGFCAVCDWIGSNVEAFPYRPSCDVPLRDYLTDRVREIASGQWLHRMGLVATSKTYRGVRALLGATEHPRGVQTLIDELPLSPSLTLIEASTGSGKTEAAFAYAWRLVDAGVADSVVMALPTQATANAMLGRAETFAGEVFGNANVVLAHGKSRFNPGFERLVATGRHTTAQGAEDASVQCASWLASSRKRLFLGQMGVCTVDQALLSVLPIRHSFVRGFGIQKSVLVVDEVHAYDTYMHGLLGVVLARQKAIGGSAILLSATLPPNVRDKLFAAWDAEAPSDAPYPVIWNAGSAVARRISVSDGQRPERREVGIECLKLSGAFPDNETLERVIAAAHGGALVAVVVNLVDDCQRIATALRGRTSLPIDVFHARFRFADRQMKERAAIEGYGRHAPRTEGRILVATQVVEQSLDLDFDWIVTQICPVDLLFQRIGRLHRHVRPRPSGFDAPRCTVLSVAEDDYGAHSRIYGNARTLWRTERMLRDAAHVPFPDVYREWIDRVYERDDWSEEPPKIAEAFDAYSAVQRSREADAIRLTTMRVAQFRDEDARVTSLTRDDEMGLTVLPTQPDGRALDGTPLTGADERALAESLELNSVPVPASWERRFAGLDRDDDGRVLLPMQTGEGGGWVSETLGLRYTNDLGLEKAANEPA